MKGDIVLVSFPFTNLTSAKTRPAVVLMETQYDVTVAFITSQLKWQDQSDLVLNPSLENGLKLTSLIRLTKLATIEKQLVLGKLGELTISEIALLNKQLIILLELNR